MEPQCCGGGAQRLDAYGTFKQPKDWVARAACHKMTDLFVIPVIGRGRPRRDEVWVDGRRIRQDIEERLAQVKAICECCPVLIECRKWALTDPDPAEGMVAGGLTFQEREDRRYRMIPRSLSV